jgi:hypothetical protein
MASQHVENHIAAFIERMQAALYWEKANGNTIPIVRRKLRTVVDECGLKRATSSFLQQLQGRLATAGIYSEPPIADGRVLLNDWIRFSTGPFPPDSFAFSKEKHLQRFVESCLGAGVFRNLEPYKDHGRTLCREYRLPNGERIDLLCQERTRTGPGALVAIELKIDRQRGTAVQLMGYLDALSEIFPTRKVRGIIISGREDKVAASLLRGVSKYDIRWYCYHVSFNELPLAPFSHSDT